MVKNIGSDPRGLRSLTMQFQWDGQNINLQGIKDYKLLNLFKIFLPLKRLQATKSIFALYHLALSNSTTTDVTNLASQPLVVQPIL